MLMKSNAIDRFLKENKRLSERRFGLPYIGSRLDGEEFNPTVQEIADAIDYYGFEVRDENITTIPDIDLGNGNPMDYRPFPLAINEMKRALESKVMYKYPYTEGADDIREVLLKYVERIGFINNSPYSYKDIDEKGLSVHNITFLPSTSISFNMIINAISKPGDVVLIPAPNYGLFTIRAERSGAEVELLKLEKEDNWLINPNKLANKIDEINDSLQKVYNRRKGYVPRVVAFLNNNPNNPTGKVMGEREIELLQEIGDVCLKRGVFIIDDLVYRDITFDSDNLAKPIATISGMFRNTISLFGLSKSYGLASLRSGFIVADEIVIREIINRIFQEMDSSPDILGRALVGAFNVTTEHDKVYDEYFIPLRKNYIHKYNLLKGLINGVDSLTNLNTKEEIINELRTYIKDDSDFSLALKGISLINFPENLEPQAGFFAILDFTKLKGMKYNNYIITNEKDLLKFFYQAYRIRFLVGQSISWPYENELIARITFALEDEKIITAILNINKAISLLEKSDNIIIRKNTINDQKAIAEMKDRNNDNLYDRLLASIYKKNLNYDQLAKRYIDSYEDYRNSVLIAGNSEKIIGYSCFNYDSIKYESELIGLYATNSECNIKSLLLCETKKILASNFKNNMIVWCLKEDKSSIDFYINNGGMIVEEENFIVNNKVYLKIGIYFDL